MKIVLGEGGLNVRVLNLKNHSSLGDWMLFVTGSSLAHEKRIGDTIVHYVKHDAVYLFVATQTRTQEHSYPSDRSRYFRMDGGRWRFRDYQYLFTSYVYVVVVGLMFNRISSCSRSGRPVGIDATRKKSI